MASEDLGLLEFPTKFDIKIFGKNSDNFELTALSIVRKHFDFASETAITTRESRDKNYLSLTITVIANSREELDALYIELNGHDEILMTL